MPVVVREEQTGLLLVADEAVDLLQIVAALHGDAHVGDCGKDLLVVFPGIAEHLLDRVFLQVQLDGDGVAVLEDLVALLLQQGGQRVVSGRLRWRRTSPSLSKMASQVPMPSGTFWMYRVLTLGVVQLCR